MHNLDPNPRIVSENSHKDKNLQMIQFLLNRVYNQLSILIIDDTIETFTTSIFKIFESISESEQQRQIVKALKKTSGWLISLTLIEVLDEGWESAEEGRRN